MAAKFQIQPKSFNSLPDQEKEVINNKIRQYTVKHRTINETNGYIIYTEREQLSKKVSDILKAFNISYEYANVLSINQLNI